MGQAWDNSGTRDKRDAKSFFENREKSMKIDHKPSQINNLHFSRGREKRVKKGGKCQGPVDSE